MDMVTGILFVIGFFLLVGGAELLVRGASSLAVTAGITPLVVGLTVVAYGTSAPELAVGVQSALTGSADIALGNVIGSNIANVLFILGLSSLVTPLVVSRQIVRQEVPFMIALSLLVLLMGWDGVISRLDGTILVLGGIVYSVYIIQVSRQESKANQTVGGDDLPAPVSGIKAILLQLALVATGLCLLILGANWLVNGAVVLAHYFGLSELIIGLTIIAVGTSLPEAATSIIATMRGQRDIVVGNAIGSNIFNILLVLGSTAMVAPQGIEIAPSALYFDIPIMIAVAFACLPIFFTDYSIDRWEGALFLAYYIAYIIYLILNASYHDLVPLFDTVMLLFVIPITVITIGLSVRQAIKTHH